MFYPFMRAFAYIVLRPIYLFYARGGLKFEGQQNIPRTGGVLITPNHICFADPPTVAMAAPRHAYIMAWDALFKISVFGTVIRWLRAFPVRPGTPDRHALKFAEDKLKSGEAVIIFPEGTVSPTGALQPLRAGVLMLAQHANVPIVPAIVENTNAILPYEQVKPSVTHKRVVCRFGMPVTVAELTGGIRGGEGYKIGAARLFQLMRALQDNQPAPAFDRAELEKLVAEQVPVPQAGEAAKPRSEEKTQPSEQPAEMAGSK